MLYKQLIFDASICTTDLRYPLEVLLVGTYSSVNIVRLQCDDRVIVVD